MRLNYKYVDYSSVRYLNNKVFSMQDKLAIYPSLKEKAVIITGGASGIGEQIVRAFAAQGSNVGFLDFNKDASESLATE